MPLSKPQQLLWVVEDDPGLQYFYKETFADLFSVRQFTSLSAIREALETLTPSTSKPQLIIGDIGLPDGSFLDFLTSKEGSRLNQIPVLIVSAIDDARILRLAFKRGATDYIVKPFSSGEVQVKVERFIEQVKAVRRSQQGQAVTADTDHKQLSTQPPSSLEDGRGPEKVEGDASAEPLGDERGFQADTAERPEAFGLSVDPVTHSVSYGAAQTQLTQREFQIVNALARSLPLGLRKENLIAAVWHNVSVSPKNLEVQLSRLRKKLADVGHAVVYSAPYYILEKGTEGTTVAASSFQDSPGISKFDDEAEDEESGRTARKAS